MASVDQTEYDVEQIVAGRTRWDPESRQRIEEYLVRWRGYPPDADSWEPANQIDAPNLIAEFKRSLKRRSNNKSGKTRALRAAEEEIDMSFGTERGDTPEYIGTYSSPGGGQSEAIRKKRKRTQSEGPPSMPKTPKPAKRVASPELTRTRNPQKKPKRTSEETKAAAPLEQKQKSSEKRKPGQLLPAVVMDETRNLSPTEDNGGAMELPSLAEVPPAPARRSVEMAVEAVASGGGNWWKVAEVVYDRHRRVIPETAEPTPPSTNNTPPTPAQPADDMDNFQQVLDNMWDEQSNEIRVESVSSLSVDVEVGSREGESDRSRSLSSSILPAGDLQAQKAPTTADSKGSEEQVTIKRKRGRPRKKNPETQESAPALVPAEVEEVDLHMESVLSLHQEETIPILEREMRALEQNDKEVEKEGETGGAIEAEQQPPVQDPGFVNSVHELYSIVIKNFQADKKILEDAPPLFGDSMPLPVTDFNASWIDEVDLLDSARGQHRWRQNLLEEMDELGPYPKRVEAACKLGDYELTVRLLREWAMERGVPGSWPIEVEGQMQNQLAEELFSETMDAETGTTLLMATAWTRGDWADCDASHGRCRLLGLLASMAGHSVLQQQTREGLWTALMVSCKAGSPCLTKALIGAGAALSLTNEEGETAVDLAAYRGDQETVFSLVGRGGEALKTQTDWVSLWRQRLEKTVKVWVRITSRTHSLQPMRPLNPVRMKPVREMLKISPMSFEFETKELADKNAVLFLFVVARAPENPEQPEFPEWSRVRLTQKNKDLGLPDLVSVRLNGLKQKSLHHLPSPHQGALHAWVTSLSPLAEQNRVKVAVSALTVESQARLVIFAQPWLIS